MSGNKEKGKVTGSPLLYSVEIACANMEGKLVYATKEFETRQGAMLCANTIKDNGVSLIGTAMNKAGKPSTVAYITRPEEIWSISVWGPDLDKETETDFISVDQFTITNIVEIETDEE